MAAHNRLNARAVASISKPGRHSDGGCLYLNVTASGARSWIFLYKFGGRQREMGLGSTRDVPLAKARELAAQYRQTLAAGNDPMGTRQAAKVTFGKCSDELFESIKGSWRSTKHQAQWRTTLVTYAASLWSLPVDKISTDDVLRVLKPVWITRPETASRLRGRIEAVLDAAKARGLRTDDNPARWRGHLANLLPRRSKLQQIKHHAALSYNDMPAFLAELREKEGMSARALEFTILTAARTGEATGARWPEVDLETRIWTVPAERMKAGHEHRVPLSNRAIALLKSLPHDGEFVFPGAKRGVTLSDGAMLFLLRIMRPGVTVHGFRSTFRDWAAEETGFPRDICEAALAHRTRDETVAAYARGDLLAKRRRLMDAWTSACEPRTGNVVRIKRSTAD